ncbi:hypothetical protein [Anaeromicrobium sediminis]|uniref:Uncharacterized protein n=1 Tax=Anaeromicrobium sediminis TaxID=1478221 RepID=A0A267MB48_9FIRM|nr:hypothetical protein [Anaeromicrobium sediminis]PAB56804.1 hypothetical protein CCE28_20225 [Anaeromicrobium sediminis]
MLNGKFDNILKIIIVLSPIIFIYSILNMFSGQYMKAIRLLALFVLTGPVAANIYNRPSK